MRRAVQNNPAGRSLVTPALYESSAYFDYLLKIFFVLFIEKLKGGTFFWPQIRISLNKDQVFLSHMNEDKKVAWNSFVSVVKVFL